MRLLPFDFTASVSVDGIIRDQRTIWTHHQEDPYPGGHRYEVILTGAAALEYLRGLPVGLTSRLDSRAAHRFLEGIRWAIEAPEPGIAWEFVLNTIEGVEATGDKLCIVGECSLFVRSPVSL